MKATQDKTPPPQTQNGARDNDWEANVPRAPWFAQPLRPIVWVARALAWFTEPEESRNRGRIYLTGKLIIFSAGMIYCFFYTAESQLVLLTDTTREIASETRTAEDVRYIPKLGVNDGAEIWRFIPSPWKLIRLGSNMLFGWLPGYTAFTNVQFDNYLVWLDGNFLVGSLIGAIISLFQAKSLRSVSIKVRKARLEAVKRYKAQDLDPKSLTIAKIRNAEYQHALVGNYLFYGSAIILTYAYEIVTFVLAFELESSTIVFLLVNGLIEVTGFEVCYKLTGLTDIDEEVVVQ